MEKEDLNKLLDEIFIPLDFKRKNNNWVHNGKEINKVINLQKSQYSKSFYINYDYIIKDLPLNGLKSHITNRLSSSNNEEQQNINSLLNLENDISTSQRLIKLGELIKIKVVDEFNSIHSKQDLVELLKDRKVLFNIPQFVLRYLGLVNE